jgi:hypothetical protein
MCPIPSLPLADIKPKVVSSLEVVSTKYTLYVYWMLMLLGGRSDVQVGPDSKHAIVVVYDIFGFW